MLYKKYKDTHQNLFYKHCHYKFFFKSASLSPVSYTHLSEPITGYQEPDNFELKNSEEKLFIPQGAASADSQTVRLTFAVSYTHLDVYKRQVISLILR